MKWLLLCSLATVVLSKQYPLKDEAEWENFKIAFNRHYKDAKEEEFRKEIFMKNLKQIQEHNKEYEEGKTTFTEGVNQFSDRTSEELKYLLNGGED